MSDSMTTAPALSLVPQPHLEDCENLSPGELRVKYKSTYSCWQNGKARAKKLGRAWDPQFATFCGFLRIMGPRPSPDHTLDRINNDAGYSPPSNCRWASKRTQANNRSTTLKVVGTPLAEMARTLDVPASTLRSQKARGWSDAEIVAQKRIPTNTKRSPLTWPWPIETEMRWEELYREHRQAGERRVDFMLRYSKDRLAQFHEACIEEALKMQTLEPADVPVLNDDGEKMLAHWKGRVEYAYKQKALADQEQRRLKFVRAKTQATGEYDRGRRSAPKLGGQPSYDNASKDDFPFD